MLSDIVSPELDASALFPERFILSDRNSCRLQKSPCPFFSACLRITGQPGVYMRTSLAVNWWLKMAMLSSLPKTPKMQHGLQGWERVPHTEGRGQLQSRLTVLSLFHLSCFPQPNPSPLDTPSAQATVFLNTQKPLSLPIFSTQPCLGSRIMGQHISFWVANWWALKGGLLIETNLKLVASWMGGIFLLGGIPSVLA